MIKAVIYDMDDLMVNSDPIHAMAWEKLLLNYNHNFFELSEETRAWYIWMRVIDICEMIIKELNIDVNLDIFYQKRNEIFLDLIKDNLEAMPWLIESLKLFKDNNLKIALASSWAKNYIELVLERFDIAEYYDVIVSWDDVNIWKPHPETYTVAAQKLWLKPEECLVLEDAKNGIDAAIDANCKCIWIINLNTPPQDHSRANLVLNSLLEIDMDKLKNI